MERTQVNQERRDEVAPSVAGTLGQVVRAGRASETPIPVAAVVSIFDDLLAADADPSGPRTPDLDDVLIDQAGVARLEVAADLPSIGRLLVEAMADDVPGAGRWLIDRLNGSDTEAPSDAAQLRGWLRDAFGQPADRSEVIELVTSASAPLPVPEPVSSDDDAMHDLETIPPNGALMAPLLGLGPPMQASIPTDPIRKRTIPIGPIVEPADASAPAASGGKEDTTTAPPEAESSDAASDVEAEPAGTGQESITLPEKPADGALAQSDDNDTIVPAAEIVSALDAFQQPDAVDEEEEATADIHASPSGIEDAPEDVADEDPVTEFADHDGDTATLTMTALSREEIVQARSKLPRVASTDDGAGSRARGASLPSFEARSAPFVRSIPALDIPSAVPSDTLPDETPLVAPGHSDRSDRSSPSSRPGQSNRPDPSGTSSSSKRSGVVRSRPVSSSNAPTLGVIQKTQTARNRPVVRHQVRRDHKISVPVAPAARRNARQSRGQDSIMGPSERAFPWGWMVLVGMVGAAAYYLLFT